MQLSPGSGWAHHWFAHSLEAQGRLDEALIEMRASLALDPLAVPIYWDVANELIRARRYDECLRHLDKALELFPGHPMLLFFRAEAYYGKGDVQSAHAVVETMKTVVAGMPKLPFFISYFGVEAAHDGRRAEAERTLAELERLRATGYVEPLLVAELCVALGDHRQLRLWFNRGYEERSTLFVYGPIMKDYYGNDPEVEALIAKVR